MVNWAESWLLRISLMYFFNSQMYFFTSSALLSFCLVDKAVSWLLRIYHSSRISQKSATSLFYMVNWAGSWLLRIVCQLPCCTCQPTRFWQCLGCMWSMILRCARAIVWCVWAGDREEREWERMRENERECERMRENERHASHVTCVRKNEREWVRMKENERQWVRMRDIRLMSHGTHAT